MENKSYLLKGAMTYGLIMGIYWAAKYIFFILSLSVPTMSVVYLALTLVVPVPVRSSLWTPSVRTRFSKSRYCFIFLLILPQK